MSKESPLKSCVCISFLCCSKLCSLNCLLYTANSQEVFVEHKSDNSGSIYSSLYKLLFSVVIPVTRLSPILLHCFCVWLPITYSCSIAFYSNSFWVLQKLFMSLWLLSSCRDLIRVFQYFLAYTSIHLCTREKILLFN